MFNSSKKSESNIEKNENNRIEIFVTEQGRGHIDRGMPNNQDKGFITDRIYGIFDGCSSTKEPEVGAQKFADAIKARVNEITSENIKQIIEEEFWNIINSTTMDELINRYFFTMIICIEDEDKFDVFYAGDGYIILFDKNDHMTICELNASMDFCPAFYAYNYTGYTMEKMGEGNIILRHMTFSKERYKSVLVSSDGISNFIDHDYDEKDKFFTDVLREGKQESLTKLCDDNNTIAFDDIVICGYYNENYSYEVNENKKKEVTNSAVASDEKQDKLEKIDIEKLNFQELYKKLYNENISDDSVETQNHILKRTLNKYFTSKGIDKVDAIYDAIVQYVHTPAYKEKNLICLGKIAVNRLNELLDACIDDAEKIKLYLLYLKIEIICLNNYNTNSKGFEKRCKKLRIKIELIAKSIKKNNLLNQFKEDFLFIEKQFNKCLIRKFAPVADSDEILDIYKKLTAKYAKDKYNGYIDSDYELFSSLNCIENGLYIRKIYYSKEDDMDFIDINVL